MSSYGLGYVDITNLTAYDIQLPEGMHSYRGPETQSQLLGCKGKTDYNGDFWFFAVDDQINPTVLWLCRSRRLPNGSIQLDYVQCPNYRGYVPKPTQLTVDKNGVVYYTTGVISQYYIAFYKAEVTLPFVVTFSYIEWYNNLATWLSIGIALNKSHTHILTVVTQSDLGLQPTYILNTDVNFTGINQWQNFDDVYTVLPTNIETDVSGTSFNDNYSVYVYSAAGNTLIVRTILINTGTGAMTVIRWVTTENEPYNRSVAIKTDGKLITLVRNDFSPNPQRAYQYEPKADHKYQNQTLLNLSQPYNAPTHLDVYRVLNDLYIGSGFTGTGPIRLLPTDGLQSDRFTRNRYQTICTAADREIYA